MNLLFSRGYKNIHVEQCRQLNGINKLLIPVKCQSIAEYYDQRDAVVLDSFYFAPMNVKDELKYGFWMAFVLFIWWVVEYLMGFQTGRLEHLSTSVMLSNLTVLGLGLYLTLNNTKSKTPSSDLHFSTLFLSGGVALIGSSILIYGLSILFYKIVNPDWVATMTQANLELLSETPTPERLEELKQGYGAQYGAGSMGLMNFSRMVMFGLFILLIEAFAVLKSGKTT